MGYTTIIKRIGFDEIQFILWSEDYFKETILTDEEFDDLKECVNNFEGD